MREKEFDQELGEIFNTFEQSFLEYMENPSSYARAFDFKNGYIDMKYDVVKLFLQAVSEHKFMGSLDFDFEAFRDKQREESPLLKADVENIVRRKQ